MEKTIKRSCSILICIIMLVLTGCASNQPGYLALGDFGVGQVSQLIARAGTDPSNETEQTETEEKEDDEKDKDEKDKDESDSSTKKMTKAEKAALPSPEPADVVIQVAVTVELDGVLKAFDVENAERCYDTAAAADLLDTKWMVIKTVQDFADGNKSATEGDIRSLLIPARSSLM